MNNNRKLIEPKQIIVIRKDLNMSPGKLAAQVSHASLGCITNLMKKEICEDSIDYILNVSNNKALEEWISGRFTKVILYVKSEQALLNLKEKADQNNIINCLIKDAGFTEFDKPTYTCLGLGPDYPINLDKITKKLQLFKG